MDFAEIAYTYQLTVSFIKYFAFSGGKVIYFCSASVTASPRFSEFTKVERCSKVHCQPMNVVVSISKR